MLRQYAGKRTLDVLVSSTLLILLSPLILLAYVAVLATSPGGAVYRQTRVGALGQQFVLLKFPRMRKDSSDSRTSSSSGR